MDNKNLHHDRRQFQRVRFESSAILSQNDIRTWVRVLDCSLKGILVDGFDISGFDLTKTLQLTLSLADNADIIMDLCLAHQSQSGNKLRCGFRCVAIDLDSIAHLRRLVELNLGKAGALDRELSELIDLH